MSTNADAACFLSTAIEKHARHYKQFDGSLEYVIMYSDLSLLNYLLASPTKFTVEKYKDDLLKPYSKTIFWLCEKSEFEGCNESSSESDLEKPSIFTSPSTSATMPCIRSIKCSSSTNKQKPSINYNNITSTQ